MNFIDSLISDQDKNTPREVILQLKGLEEKAKENKIFISVEKNRSRNFILYYESKFHRDTLTIANYLAAVIAKQYSKPILYIFNQYHQEIAKDVI